MARPDLAARYGPWALLAGGSEGIGSAFAHRLAAQGLKLALLARKREPLEALAIQLRERYGAEVLTIAQDLTLPGAVDAILATLAGREVGFLIYNAGADSRVANFLDRPSDESERMIALNVTTPMKLVRQLAPRMAERGRGGILLVSTFVSVVGTPGNALYASTKAFGNVFAEGMWYELGERGIDVLSVIVGIVRTPAMERMGMTFEGVTTAADPYAIVDEALAGLGSGPVLHAGGTYEEVQRLRTLPRAEAVRTIAAFSQAAQATGKP